MQLSRATDQAEPTGALLLPVEAVASAEPAKSLARGRREIIPADGTARYRNRARSERAASDTAAGGVQFIDGVEMTGWSQVRRNGAVP